MISGSSAFSKSSLNIWKFMVHGLLKPGLENFEHYFVSVWDECNCVVVWAFFGIGMKTDLFQSSGHCWVFQICWHIECSTFTASSFRYLSEIVLITATKFSVQNWEMCNQEVCITLQFYSNILEILIAIIFKDIESSKCDILYLKSEKILFH